LIQDPQPPTPTQLFQSPLRPAPHDIPSPASNETHDEIETVTKQVPKGTHLVAPLAIAKLPIVLDTTDNKGEVTCSPWTTSSLIGCSPKPLKTAAPCRRRTRQA
jgi:hypothetical protein